MKLLAREIASGLMFPEGPVALPDGTILVVEIGNGRLTRVAPSGRCETVAELGGGTNGAAIGPDGKCYVCNNGGFTWDQDATGFLRPTGRAEDYTRGRIEQLDLATGAATVLYDQCDGIPLKGPNDIVFDVAGGFWFRPLGYRPQPQRTATPSPSMFLRSNCQSTNHAFSKAIPPVSGRSLISQNLPNYISDLLSVTFLHGDDENPVQRYSAANPHNVAKDRKRTSAFRPARRFST